MTKTTISISLSKEIIEKIDSVRTIATRSAYIEFALNEFFEKLGKDKIRCAEIGLQRKFNKFNKIQGFIHLRISNFYV